jgi:hypothetical protein
MVTGFSIAAMPAIINAEKLFAVPTRNTHPTILIQPQIQLSSGAHSALDTIATQ